MTSPSPERPYYSKQREQGGRNLYCITADEGWRQRILCDGMYGDLADWLITQIQGRPMPGTPAAETPPGQVVTMVLHPRPDGWTAPPGPRYDPGAAGWLGAPRRPR